MTIADKRVPLLFLISDTGGGHRSAAQAVGEALESQYPGQFEPVITDPLTGPGTPPAMRWFVSLYAPLIRLTPWLWHVSWRFSNRRWGLSLMYKTAFAPARTTVMRAIDACRPAAVVAFHGMVTRPAVMARQRALPAVPVLTVITDLVTAHRAWRETRVDQIAVPSLAVGRSCQADGFPARRAPTPASPSVRRYRYASHRVRAALAARRARRGARPIPGRADRRRSALLQGDGAGARAPGRHRRHCMPAERAAVPAADA